MKILNFSSTAPTPEATSTRTRRTNLTSTFTEWAAKLRMTSSSLRDATSLMSENLYFSKSSVSWQNCYRRFFRLQNFSRSFARLQFFEQPTAVDNQAFLDSLNLFISQSNMSFVYIFVISSSHPLY